MVAYYSLHQNLVEDIHHIHNNDDEVTLSHLFREANLVADGLGKHGLSLDNNVNIFECS
jgi:hypothetical protein